VPIIVIIDDKVSIKLLTASKIIALELVIRPIIILKITNNTFTNIPIKLAFIITLFLLILSPNIIISKKYRIVVNKY
jgi:hypothetical protein